MKVDPKDGADAREIVTNLFDLPADVVLTAEEVRAATRSTGRARGALGEDADRVLLESALIYHLVQPTSFTRDWSPSARGPYAGVTFPLEVSWPFGSGWPGKVANVFDNSSYWGSAEARHANSVVVESMKRQLLLAASLGSADAPHVTSARETLQACEVSFAQSLPLQNVTIGDIMKMARKPICFFPAGYGAYVGTMHLSASPDFVTAFTVAGAGAAITLMLCATRWLGERILDRAGPPKLRFPQTERSSTAKVKIKVRPVGGTKSGKAKGPPKTST